MRLGKSAYGRAISGKSNMMTTRAEKHLRGKVSKPKGESYSSRLQRRLREKKP